MQELTQQQLFVCSGVAIAILMQGYNFYFFYVRITDDVMSDCVGGDYIIEKMPKNSEIGGANS